MQLSFELILEELNMEPEQQLRVNPLFSSVELYILGSSDLSGKTLLVSTLSEALLVPKREGLYFLCIRDRIVDNTESDDSMQGICVVKRNMDIKELFNAVQRVFFRIQSWVLDMNRSVMEKRGLQDLIDMSEGIIGNHIAVMDGTFKVLAITYGIETDDVVSAKLTERGYHPAETVGLLQSARRFEEYSTADEGGLIVSDDKLISQYTSVKKIYRYDHSYFALVVMVCCGRRCTPGVLHLYQMLLDNVSFYIENSRPSISGRTPVESIIRELIDGHIVSEQEARERTASLGLSFNGSFDLDILDLGDSNNTPINRITLELEHLLKNSRILTYKGDVLILNSYNDNQHMNISNDRKAQKKEMISAVGNAQCGSSNLFYSLWELPIAYEQAKIAKSIGTRIQESHNKFFPVQQYDSLYMYEDYYLHHIIAHCLETNTNVFTKSQAFDCLSVLSSYDRKNNSKTLDLLHAYLKCGGSATETSGIIHMHRNTVLYHVSKIEDILGISMEDTEIRIKLLLALKAMEMGFFS